jgi:6-phosphogluconolactonase
LTETRLHVFPSLAELSQAAARQFSQAVAEAIAVQGAASVALSGGSTPAELYRMLALPPFRQDIPWGQVHFYWGDERCVPPTDPESCFGMAYALLLGQVPVPAANIHRALGELAPAAAAADYAAQLAQAGEIGHPWPHFDLVLLGMGADGHTASLFPNQLHPEESSLSVIPVTAAYQGRPANRISLTPPVFNSARRVLFLVTGENKAAVLEEALNGASDPLRLPVQRIRPTLGEVIWMVDQAAASRLTRK